MIQNHIKIALRFFAKNKLFTMINISGLTIGVTAFLLLTQYVGFEKNYDKGLENVYRVTLTSNLSSDHFNTSAANHPAVGSAMKAEFPEVQKFARMVNTKIMNSRGVISYKNGQGDAIRSNINDYNIYFADGSILGMFHIPLLQGDINTALDDPGVMIISSGLAQRFFGNENPVGKDMTINSDGRIKITGVFQDLPQNTHLKFDMLVSLSSLDFPMETIWVWPEFYNYVGLKPGIEPKTIEAKFPGFVHSHLDDIMNEYGFEASMGLQPVKDIHLKSHLSKEMFPNSSEATLYFLMIVALFVIGIAMINFINLSTSKSLERAKEVGMKKVVGAQRSTLIYQFLCESLIINFIAMSLALILVAILMEPFNVLVGVEVLSVATWTKPSVWVIIVSAFFAGGLFAGLYPAFVLSSFKPITVLKGKFHRSTQGAVLRKGLVVAQFTISIALISGTFIVYQQFNFMQDQSLGFESDQNLVITAPIDVDSTIIQKIEVFKNEITRNPNITSATMSTEIPGMPMTSVDAIRNLGEEKSNSVPLKFMAVDHDFLDTYKIRLLAGRGFTKEDKSAFYPIGENGDENLHRVVINKATARSLGYGNPEDAINKKIVFKYGPAERTAEVIGVMDNYHHQSLQMGYDNILFMYSESYLANYLTVNISGNRAHQTVEDIEAQYNRLFPRDPFTYFFLDDFFNQQYAADLKFGLICLLFSGLAIFIAALGLFGIGSHMALEKVKEISVRKVMGASTLQALLLIPKKLLGLVLISGTIAIPIVYFITKSWLEGYAFKTDVNPWMFVIPLFLVMFVALLSILTQSLKSAFINPAVSLKNE